MEYLATFHTHFGATRFFKYCQRKNLTAKMSPVPRELSSSCGVCVRFTDSEPPKKNEHEDMEYCYKITPNGTYLPVEGLNFGHKEA